MTKSRAIEIVWNEIRGLGRKDQYGEIPISETEVELDRMSGGELWRIKEQMLQGEATPEAYLERAMAAIKLYREAELGAEVDDLLASLKIDQAGGQTEMRLE